MATFLDLPPELVAKISNSLALHDLKRTRLACKQLGHYLENCVFHSLTLHITYQNRDESISMIRSLATGECQAISRSARHLSIGSLSATTMYDPRIRTVWVLGDSKEFENKITDKIKNGQRVRYIVYPAELERNEHTDTIVSQMDATVKEYLFSALVSLQNISSVKWVINNHSKDPEWALHTVVKALQTLERNWMRLRRLRSMGLPHPSRGHKCFSHGATNALNPNNYKKTSGSRVLKNLGISRDKGEQAPQSNLRSLDIYSHEAPTLRLDLIQGLHAITIVSTSTSHDNVGTFQPLAGMIPKSPELESITIMRRGFRTCEASPNANLHQLFSMRSPSTPLVHLRKLVLERMSLESDEITIPHLRHLVSLKLTDIFEPSPEPYVAQVSDDSSDEWEDEGPPTARGCAPQRSREEVAGSTLDQFWFALSSADVHLEEIAVDQVGNGFLSYLASYAGLKKLTIQGLYFPNSTVSDEFATEFYGTPLLRHADTLEELDVISGYEGTWCISEHNVSAFAQCQGLIRLGITVDSTLMNRRYKAEAKDNGRFAKQDAICFLLESACSRFPHLRTLRVTSADPEHSRLRWRRSASSRHHSRIFDKIKERLGKFSPPALFLQLPAIPLGGRHFVPRFGPRKAGKVDDWHYRDIADDTKEEKRDGGEDD